jgi:hypothetical protein
MYPDARVHHLSGNPTEADAFKSSPEVERHQIDVLMGHQHFGMHQWLRPGARYVTMLRDPIDRCISHYYYVLRKPDHHLHQRVVDANMSLVDYFLQRTTIELDNDQVRWLNEDGHRCVPYGHVTREMLDTAKRRIAEDIEVVGLSERFDESLQLLADHFGWENVEYTPTNVTPNRPRSQDVEPRALEVIEECNQFDRELYEFAAQLLAKHLTAAGKAA